MKNETPDIILVPCGGGALLAGVAAAVKLSGLANCRVFGVEPQSGKYILRLVVCGSVLSLGGMGHWAMLPPLAWREAFCVGCLSNAKFGLLFL